ncbi:hypothetical protein ACFE04_010391 [Oxalis oulophora]
MSAAIYHHRLRMLSSSLTNAFPDSLLSCGATLKSVSVLMVALIACSTDIISNKVGRLDSGRAGRGESGIEGLGDSDEREMEEERVGSDMKPCFSIVDISLDDILFLK